MDLLEKQVAAQCDEFIQKLGGQVVRLEQRRASKIARGLPDRRYRIFGIVIWWETKAEGDKARLTQDEYDFLKAEAEHDEPGGVGIFVDLRRMIDEIKKGRQVGDARGAAHYMGTALREEWHARGLTPREKLRKASPFGMAKTYEKILKDREATS